ncbi:MAG TPA: hypothetical protein VEX43_17890 [Chthoniobacterales bacterium]|nr:hypothetical protein [Chthoniobacterales bacterium]
MKSTSIAAAPLRSRLALAGIVGVLVAVSFTLWPRPKAPHFYFAVTMRAATPGFAQLFYGIDSAAREADSFRIFVEGGNREAHYQFPMPDGRYLNLRFDPTDQAANTITLSRARIVNNSGNLIRAVAPAQIKPLRQIEPLATSNTEVVLSSLAGADDPAVVLTLESPVILKSYNRASLRTMLRRFAPSFLITAGLVLLCSSFLLSKMRKAGLSARQKAATWAHEQPHRLVLVVAAAAVVLSCYPIVFFGKSFVSPNNHSHSSFLYGEMPTVPGYREAATDNEQGSDLGATPWYSWPTSVVQSKALFKHFELPLWNRYDSCGLPLLGQGQSMLGDPLHLLALLTNGSTAAWDLKYLIAKFIFAASLGLCVLQLTRHLPAALVIALSSSFIGFFSYRYSHPAFFSMCYAPFILLCWFKLIDAPKGRPSALWLGLMVLANWMMINSGTVKEAYVLLLAMNLCGCLTLLLGKSVAGRIAKLRQAFVAQLLFLLIATPIWLTFLMALRNSWTGYDVGGGAFQIQPALLIGLFDDIFYRQFNANELHLVPSANFLILAGVLWFVLSARRLDQQKLWRGLVVTCLLALALVFGVVPPALISRIPFLGQIYHIDNTFSCVAIVCLLILAGFGIKAFWNDAQTAEFKPIYFRLLASVAVLLALYLGTTDAAQRSTRTLLQVGEHIPKSPFFWGYSFLLVAALVIAPWLFRNAFRANRVGIGQALALGSIFLLLHWRHGMHLITPFDHYVMNPQERTNLIADASPAVRLVRNAPEPFRSAGLQNNLAPGYGGAIGIEQPDSSAPLLNKHFKSLLDAYQTKLLSDGTRSGRIDDQLENDLPLFDMLNVRYLLGSTATTADVIPSLTKIASLDLNVYESSKVWPRAFFADRLAGYGSESDFVKLLKHGDGRPFAAIPQSEHDQPADVAGLLRDPSAAAARQIVPATGYALTNNTTSFKIAAPAAGVVVLTEPYEKGNFQLRVNGAPASYFRVNSAFRGVFVPAAGDYHFSFAYWPRHLTISLWIAAFGITLLLLWLGSIFKYSRREA